MPPRKPKDVPRPMYFDRMKELKQAYLDEHSIILKSAPSSRTGTINLEKRTKTQYERHYIGLSRFCILIGDVETILSMDRCMPQKGCPPANPETLANYLRYKTLKPGEKLVNFALDTRVEEEESKTSDQVLLKDVFGNDIQCVGGWKAPVNVTQFTGAISTLHKSRGQGDQYKDVCADCLEEWKGNRASNGCEFHPGQFLFKRRGNPTTCQLFTNAYKEALKCLKENEIVGAYQLLPKELRDIRTLLLSTNKLSDLQLYTAILVSIHLFLRHDEFADLEMRHVKPNLCQIKNGMVSRLAIQICGKSDNVWRTMFLHRCDDVPEFCPVRHLLVYLYIAEIQDGLLFPRLKHRDKKMEYNTLLAFLKRKLNGVMDRPKGITTHVFRKTGYLFAAWGDADFDTARKSARHKNYATAQLYMEDAIGLLQSSENSDPNAKYQVPRFKMAIAINERAHQQIVDQESTRFRTIPNEAAEFMKMHGLHNHRLSKSPKFLSEKVCQFQPKRGNIEQITEILKQHLPQQIAHTLQHKITQAILEEARNIQDRDNEVMAPSTSEEQPPGARRRKRGGDEDLEDRKKVKKLRGIAILNLLLQINETKPENTNELTNAARVWVLTSLNPVMQCLENHFGGEKSAFLSKWNLSNGIYNFGKKYCKGSSEFDSCHL